MRPSSAVSASRPILVVDDDEALRWLLFWMLTDEGYSVTEAPDGAVALAQIREAAPGLILLDMRMPMLDGWAFARRYRALPGPHAPIICVTAAAGAEDVAARGAQIGAVATLSKPFDLDDLLALVSRYVPPPVAETP
jgi:CheY-like chemotaxis protein